MKTILKIKAASLFMLIGISAFVVTDLGAQSTSIDKPTQIELNTIEGEGDGKAETLYYYLDVNKGNVKVVVDAKTDDRSTPLRVTLMDEDGKELLPIYVVATGSGKREVASRKFVRSQRVIVKIATQDDPQVKLLTYKIRFDVPEDVPKQIVAAPEQSTSSNVPPTAPDPVKLPPDPAANSAGSTTPPEPPSATAVGPSIKATVKAKAKKEVKKILSIIIDDK